MKTYFIVVIALALCACSEKQTKVKIKRSTQKLTAPKHSAEIKKNTAPHYNTQESKKSNTKRVDRYNSKRLDPYRSISTQAVIYQPIEKTTFENPSMEKWENGFGKDPQWMQLYQESISRYLTGIDHNLNQQPNLRISRSKLIEVYGKKMFDTFQLTPEFAEFAKNRFSESPEFYLFVSKHSNQIIED
jgi:hypothetical protein